MPTTDDKAIAVRDRPGGGLRRLNLALAAAVCGLAACTPLKQAATAPAGGNAPIAVEKLPAPVALAPSMTGSPAAPAAARPVAAKPPAPPPRAAVTPPAAAAAPPATAAAATGPPPVQCPLGTIGMWSPPDVVGTPVYICRQLNPR